MYESVSELCCHMIATVLCWFCYIIRWEHLTKGCVSDGGTVPVYTPGNCLLCVGCLLFLLSWDVILVMHYAVKCCSGKNLHPVDGQQLNSYHHLSLRYGVLGQQGVWICTWLCTTHLSIAVLQLWKCGNGAGYYTLHIAKNLYVSVAVHHKSVPPYLHCTFSLCG